MAPSTHLLPVASKALANSATAAASPPEVHQWVTSRSVACAAPSGSATDAASAAASERYFIANLPVLHRCRKMLREPSRRRQWRISLRDEVGARKPASRRARAAGTSAAMSEGYDCSAAWRPPGAWRAIRRRHAARAPRAADARSGPVTFQLEPATPTRVTCDSRAHGAEDTRTWTTEDAKAELAARRRAGAADAEDHRLHDRARRHHRVARAATTRPTSARRPRSGCGWSPSRSATGRTAPGCGCAPARPT